MAFSNVQKILIRSLYNQFALYINNPTGVCAMLGNIMDECGMRADKIEAAKLKKLGLTDEEYRRKVDSGEMSLDAFFHDSTGIGLVQWTWWERKKKFYDYAKARKRKLWEKEIQVEYICEEIKKYTTPCLALKLPGWGSIEECTRTIMLKYEAPADQSEKHIQKRIAYAKEIYKMLQEEGRFK